VLIDEKGQVYLSGLRQVLNMSVDGRIKSSVFSVVGDNVEWAAPEIVAQVRPTRSFDMYLSFRIIDMMKSRTFTVLECWPLNSPLARPRSTDGRRSRFFSAR
jgi:hypothetical protein